MRWMHANGNDWPRRRYRREGDRDGHRTRMDLFFAPRSIAVVGASRNPQKLGYVLLDNLKRANYQGDLYPVNPRGEPILGLHTYPTVLDLPRRPDLAILTVPAEAVAEVLDQSGRKGLRAAVVVTAGFRETGPEGRRAEEQVLAVARRYGIRLVGPNSVGIINTSTGMNATFAETPPFQFPVGMLSQSGAIATAILDWARTTGMGFSKFVSLGNMADLDEVDFLDYMAHDPETKIIVGYLEGISHGRRFMDVARRITVAKPLILLKVGTTPAGQRAAQSHTGALAASEAVVDAAFRQTGVIRANTMSEFFDYIRCFSHAPLPKGPRVAVGTNAGGPGVMASDAVERMGLQLAKLSPATVEVLEQALPHEAAISNPIDVLGDAAADRYQAALEAVCGDPAVDGVLVLLTPQRVTEPERTARVISYIVREGEKPLLAVFMGGNAVARGRAMLDEARVPVYFYPERAVRALSALMRYSAYLQEVAPAAPALVSAAPPV